VSLRQPAGFHHTEFRQTISERAAPQRFHDGAIGLGCEPDEVALHIGTDEASMGNATWFPEALVPYDRKINVLQCDLFRPTAETDAPLSAESRIDKASIGKRLQQFPDKGRMGVEPFRQMRRTQPLVLLRLGESEGKQHL
jgi:hypothetical protein